jgi:subtilase family serine protease
VHNHGKTASITTTVQIWDGDPDAGGTLIGTQQLSRLSPGVSTRVEWIWNVLGQAGVHTLTVVADPGDLVAEFYEQNNHAATTIALPSFDLEIETNATSYDEGDIAIITVRATNLTTVPTELIVTTTAEFERSQAVFTDVRTLNVPAAVQVSDDVMWDTVQLAKGSYTLTVQANSTGSQASDSAIATMTISAGTLLQICVALDGSESIDGYEILTMTQGLADAVRDDGIIPHNGSVELGVVQFGGDGEFVIEAPATRIVGTEMAEEVVLR